MHLHVLSTNFLTWTLFFSFGLALHGIDFLIRAGIIIAASVYSTSVVMKKVPQKHNLVTDSIVEPDFFAGARSR